MSNKSITNQSINKCILLLIPTGEQPYFRERLQNSRTSLRFIFPDLDDFLRDCIQQFDESLPPLAGGEAVGEGGGREWAGFQGEGTWGLGRWGSLKKTWGGSRGAFVREPQPPCGHGKEWGEGEGRGWRCERKPHPFSRGVAVTGV